MPPDQTLLTIAIPTYNRSQLLRQLLDVLAPQVAGHSEIELLISDNASPDDTPKVIQQCIDAGMAIRYHRQPENVGSDANFISCFHMATGKYFWLCGDDDIILPGAIDEVLGHISALDYDLIYLTAYGFRDDWKSARPRDAFDRRFHTITDPLHFAKVVNFWFTFISGIIVNKNRLGEVPHEDPSAFLNTNLPQLSWTLPLLRHHRRSLVLWNRPVATRAGNAGGYSVGEVFGVKISEITTRCLPDRPELSACILNFFLRRGLPATLYIIRSSGNKELHIEKAEAALKKSYGRNFRYWLFAFPVLRLPLPLAWAWLKGTEAVSRILYMLLIPGFWRKEI